jgi:signal transduction histidine kinase
MRTSKARALGLGVWAASVLFGALALALAVMNHELAGDAGDLVLFAAIAAVGLLVTRSQPRNALGWLFLGSASLVMLVFSLYEVGVYGRMTDPGAIPLAIWLVWLGNWGWLLGFGPLLVYMPLLFPDGALPSRRWRPFAWGIAVFLVLLVVASMLVPATLLANNHPAGSNPLGLTALGSFLRALISASYPIAAVATLVAAASVIVRFRPASAEERRQIKWFGYGVVFMAVMFTVGGIASGLGHPSASDALSTIGSLGLPVGAGVAILRYRLWDVDVIVSRTVVYGLLAAFITAMYVGVVVGVGTAIGSKGNVFLSIVATAIVAVSFHPIRERARHLANRLVFGKRATPYEVLSHFAERMAATYSIEDVLPRTARILAEGTGARRAEVWVRVGGELELRASWPSSNGSAPAVRLAGQEVPSLPGATREVPVRHQGELLGALAVFKAPNDPVRPAEQKLLSDVASQAGLILRNVRLIEELHASRRRLVAAQDAERRRLERNIHDGAQQQLVALAVKLGLAQKLAEPGSRVRPFLEQLQTEAAAALEDLRDLASWIYPPLLADRGLVAALDAQARKAALPVTVRADGVGRYGQDAEAAVYFCVLEALQNVAKYAGATRAEVRLAHRDDDLSFAVSDDGRGFDTSTTSYGTGLQGMADRLSALGGSVEIRSATGQGTTVTGRVPAPPVEHTEDERSTELSGAER